MATKKDSTQKKEEESKTDLLWRKPIILEEDEDDPLATLYRRREVSRPSVETVTEPQKADNKIVRSTNNKTITKETTEQSLKKKTARVKTETFNQPKNAEPQSPPKVTESELKAFLKIKSDAFQFTDIREILRGKSLDIYAYLRHLSGETGVCKIKHLDLMRKLDISRPTLFKQGEWLTRLFLIEKRNVPGDHFGTSYTVFRLEDVLPVSESLVEQLESHIKYVQTIE